MYVYKLNEDIILYTHSSENNQRSSHVVLARWRHKPGHPHDRMEGGLENSRGVASPPPPSFQSLLIKKKKKAPLVSSPFFPFSFLETGWLYQMEFHFSVIL